jgi:hypothetical protein
MASVDRARKLRVEAGTCSLNVLSLKSKVVQTKDSTRKNRRIFKVRVSYCIAILQDRFPCGAFGVHRALNRLVNVVGERRSRD